MLAELYRKAKIREEREKWLAWYSKWEEWDQRKTEARDKGVDFTEPRPPVPDDYHSNKNRSLDN